MPTGNTRLIFQGFFIAHGNFLINWFQFIETKLRSIWQGIREVKKKKDWKEICWSDPSISV